jgi:TetR/AcrR family transcriptional repressor of bet genes
MAKTDTLKTKPAERLSRTRQRLKLIDACITALHQHGPSRTTIDKVVSIADMSPGIVNFYFETKAALLLAALEHLALEFETLVLEPLSAMRDQPMQALHRLIELYLDPQIASARKVSVWYAFWGESSSRREYFTICGKHDLAFAALVQELVARAIRERGMPHLDADAISLGLIGCLEMMWQEIAFQGEADVDRETAKKRCRAYLHSVFPNDMPAGYGLVEKLPFFAGAMLHAAPTDDALFRNIWHFACSLSDVAHPGDYVAWQSALYRALIVRGDDGVVRAFIDTCLHRPHALSQGRSGNFGATITCAADGAVYGLDGLRQTHGGGLAPLAIFIGGDAIFVKLGAEGSRPASRLVLSDAPCESRSFDVAADWRLVVEHWADAYFDTPARLFGDEGAAALHVEDELSVSQTRPLRGQPKGFARPFYLRLCGSSEEALIVRKLFWPNLFVEARPDGTVIRQVLPMQPGQSRIRVLYYRTASETRVSAALSYLARRTERSWEQQDIQAIVSTQTTLAGDQPTGALAQFKAWLAIRQTQT